MTSTHIKHFAITGGIGSGKSFVCKLLARHGITVYDCDDAAKRLMREDSSLQDALSRTVGVPIFADGVLQKALLSRFLLASETNKMAIDDIIHPAVARDFMASGLTWLESAILFDSGFYKRIPLDGIVCVTAPLDVRIRRIMTRDHISRQKAQEWIDRQWPQGQIEAHSDFLIDNDGEKDLEGQIDRLLTEIQ